MTPLISVVIPAYNVEGYIHHCIESILNQSLTNIEILIYDDGSTDGTPDMIRTFGDPRIKRFRGDTNRGVVFARNFLLKQARAEFVAFQDADDWSHEDRLLFQLEMLRSKPHLAGCGTQYVKTINRKPILYSKLPCDALTIKKGIPDQFYFLPGSIVVRRCVIEKAGLYNPFFGNDGNEDIYLMSKIILASGFENVNSHLYYYNLNLRSLTKLGYQNQRRIYIREISAMLLNDLIRNGTNFLEAADFDKLMRVENDCREKYKDINRFDVFENVIGQLVFYRQFSVAAREVINYMFKTGPFLPSARLLGYVIKQSLKHES